MRNQQLAEAVPLRMDPQKRLKNAPISRFSFPVPAQQNVLAEAEPNSPKTTKQTLRKAKAADRICYPRRSPREALRRCLISGCKKVGWLSRVFFSGRSPKTAALMVDLVPCEAVFRPPDTLRPERGQAFAMEV